MRIHRFTQLYLSLVEKEAQFKSDLFPEEFDGTSTDDDWENVFTQLEEINRTLKEAGETEAVVSRFNDTIQLVLPQGGRLAAEQAQKILTAASTGGDLNEAIEELTEAAITEEEPEES